MDACSVFIHQNSRRRYAWLRGTNPLFPLDPQKYYHLCFEVFMFATKIQNEYTSPHHPSVPYELFGNGVKGSKIHVAECSSCFYLCRVLEKNKLQRNEQGKKILTYT